MLAADKHNLMKRALDEKAEGDTGNTNINVQIIEQTVVRKEGIIIDGIMPVDIIEEVVPNGTARISEDGIGTGGGNGGVGTTTANKNGHTNGSTLP